MAKLRKFYDLDNAAKIFPVVANESRSYMFRVSVIFKEPIKTDILQEALNRTTKRFKHLNVRIRKGLFWYYFEENLKTPLIKKEDGFINKFLIFRENNDFLFRTLYFKERLSVEFFHALTDGKGALEFVNSLAYEYLTLDGKTIDPEGLVIRADAAATYQEVEDVFQKLYHKKKIPKVKEFKAHRIKGTFYRDNYNAAMHAYVALDDIKAVAKSYGVTINEFFIGMIILALKKSGKHQNYKHLARIFMPVNMRQFYPSVTLRNFASYLRINYDLNNPTLDLKTVLDFVKNEMKKELNVEDMVNAIIANVRYEQNKLLRMTPLPIKIVAMRSVYGKIGNKLNTFDTSNLGIVKLPKSMAEHISHYSFMTVPNKDTPKAMSFITFENTLTISFISKIIERDFEIEFFEILKSLGIQSQIEGNNWEVAS